MFHDVLDHGGQAFDFFDRALKVQFVVYLQDHVSGKAFLFQTAAHAGHRNLDDVAAVPCMGWFMAVRSPSRGVADFWP